MNEQELKQFLKLLLQFDTPTITNVLACYPKDQINCLHLYDPWMDDWYTDETVRSYCPEAGRRIGYAVTCTYGLPTEEGSALTFKDLFRAIKASPGPVAVVVKQVFPAEIKKKCGLYGGKVMTAFRALGVSGVVSDGPSRDLGEVRELGMQYILSGIAPGHGPFELKSINTPVTVAGMHVIPGMIIHMDEHGATCFDPQYAEQILSRAVNLSAVEERQMRAMSESEDPDEIAKIFLGQYD